MCRLFGNIGLNEISETISEKEFQSLTLLSKCGGPDHTGYYIRDRVWFGFNRLSILDITENGNQPIESPSQRYVTMLNGEIYNFRDLILEYNLNHLRSSSDSEVVSQLIDKIGFSETISRLNGMFAIVCWDIQNSELNICRDFAGIKPLFYSITQNGFVFSSQFDQILTHPWLQNWEWSETGLSEYFSMGYMVSPNTIVANVFSVEPGQLLNYKLGTREINKKKFQTFYRKHNNSILKETSIDTVNLVYETLKQTVKSQMISDVPLGVFLSGGIDSTLISAISKEINPKISSITVGFEEKDLDESTVALAYSKHLKIENKQYCLSRKEAKNILIEHNSQLTEPIADISSIPTFFANKMASADFKVMLSGDGGDELFWGYPRYQKIVNSRFLFAIPSLTAKKIYSKVFDKHDELFSTKLSAKTLGEANLKHSQNSSFSEIKEVLGLRGNLDSIKSAFEIKSLNKERILHSLRENDFYFFMQKVLTKVDRNSMSHGLEVRVPFLDLEMIKLSERIRPELTFKHQTPKYITKELLKKYITQNTIDFTKRGFTPPILNWILLDFKDEIEESIHSIEKLKLPIDYRNIYTQWVKLLKQEEANLNLIWAAYMLIVWKRRLDNIKIELC